MALRDQIKQSVTTAKRTLWPVPTPEIPEFDGQVFVTKRAAKVMARLLDAESATKDTTTAAAQFVVATAVDKDGSPVWQADDVEWLASTDELGPMVSRIAWAGRDINGLLARDWRKNAPTEGAGSPSSSVEPSIPATELT